IAAAQIEADAASLQMPAWRPRTFLFGRKIFGVNNFQRVIKHALGYQVGIEFGDWIVAIMFGQLRGEISRASEMNATTVPPPEQKFYNALEVSEIGRRLRVSLWK